MAEDTDQKFTVEYDRIWARVFIVLVSVGLMFGGALLVGTLVKSGTATVNPDCKDCSRPPLRGFVY